MKTKPKDLCSLGHFLTAKLSWKITLWVFLSIVLVEFIILLPSVQKKEDDLLKQCEEISLSTLIPALIFSDNSVSIDEMLAMGNQITPHFGLLGFAIYKRTGEFVQNFGEAPAVIDFNLVTFKNDIVYKKANDRYDIIRSMPTQTQNLFTQKLLEKYACLGNSCLTVAETILVMRFDEVPIHQEITAYIWRIIGLVTIICIFVTFATVLMLGMIIIVPILRLRNAIIAMGKSTNGSNQIIGYRLHHLATRRHDELGDVIKSFNIMNQQITDYMAEIKLQRSRLQQLVSDLGTANQQAESLLLNILPKPIAEQLKNGIKPIAESFPKATVLFADLVGFTEFSAKIPPNELIALLNDIFTAFDHLAEQYEVEKIKTIGDAYMVVGGVPLACDNHAEAIADMALDMRKVIRQFSYKDSHAFDLRIGIHTGPVIAGVIGVKKFIYDLWGDTVNTASRMEYHSLPGAIQTSESTYQLLQNQYTLEERGIIEVKGKGTMQTYWLLGKKA